MLLRRAAPSLAGRRFNIALGRSGGEDTEFFTHMHKAGGKIAYAADALVYEPVPDGRATVSWLSKRRYRMGQTHGRMLLETAGLGRWRAIALAASKSAYCFAAAALLFASPIKRHRYELRGIMHAGVVSGLFGVREIEQYGNLEKAPQ